MAACNAQCLILTCTVLLVWFDSAHHRASSSIQIRTRRVMSLTHTWNSQFFSEFTGLRILLLPNNYRKTEDCEQLFLIASLILSFIVQCCQLQLGPGAQPICSQGLKNLSFFIQIIIEMLGNLDFTGSKHWAPLALIFLRAQPCR